MKLSIDTIIIFAEDVDRLKHFYVDTLKLKLVEEITAEWVLVNAGNCHIGLHKIGKEYLAAAKESTIGNNTKIVFEVDDDIFETREALLKANVSLSEIKTFDNYNFWLCDGKDP